MGTPAAELQEPLKKLLAENKITEELHQGQTSYYPGLSDIGGPASQARALLEPAARCLEPAVGRPVGAGTGQATPCAMQTTDRPSPAGAIRPEPGGFRVTAGEPGDAVAAHSTRTQGPGTLPVQALSG